MSECLDRERLSQRENEILELAIEGLTDQQIAHRLDISPSTVNNYWVRIRGKLGQVSRTELVATVLRQQAEREMARLREESRQLVEIAEQRGQDSRGIEEAELLRSILEAIADAVVAVDHTGTIVYANTPLEEMFGYSASELVGQPISILIPHREREACRAKIEEYVTCPYPLRLGIGKVLYGRHRDGQLVRLVLALDGRPTSRGPITTCIVRNFMDEIVNVQRHAAAVSEALAGPR